MRFAFLLAFTLAACAPAERAAGPTAPVWSAPEAGDDATAPPPSPAPPTDDDVRIGRQSILGAWHAVAVVDDPEATRDLETGVLETALLVGPYGQAVLTGTDRRAGGAPSTFGGQIAGSRITLRGLGGDGTLSLEGQRLLLRDPRGRTMVFVREGDE